MRRRQPSESSFCPHCLAYHPGCPLVRSAVFKYSAEANEVSGDRLNALRGSAPRMLRRIRIDSKTMHPFQQSPVGIFTRQNPRICRPTRGRRFHVIVGWPSNVGQNGTATCTSRAFHFERGRMPNRRFSAMRARTSFLTREAGRGRSAWNRTVPLPISNPLSSPLCACTVDPR